MIGSIQWMILLHMLRNSLFMGITAVKDLDVISGEFPESCFYVEKPLLSYGLKLSAPLKYFVQIGQVSHLKHVFFYNTI